MALVYRRKLGGHAKADHSLDVFVHPFGDDVVYETTKDCAL